MKVFFDSSVVIAALFSDTGASGTIITFCEPKLIEGFISDGVVDEIKAVLKRRFPEATDLFNEFLKISKLKIITVKPKSRITAAKKWIKDPNDAKILAAAKQIGVDYLLTLDIKHFIRDANVAKVTGLNILTPGDFLNTVFRAMI